jgi:hypothetical protein
MEEWARGRGYRGEDRSNLVPQPGDGWARVAQDQIGVARVSTVFMGIDHNFTRGGPPLLFETMIFGGPEDGFQARYSTWDEAEAGHAVALHLAVGAETQH